MAEYTKTAGVFIAYTVRNTGISYPSNTDPACTNNRIVWCLVRTKHKNMQSSVSSNLEIIANEGGDDGVIYEKIWRLLENLNEDELVALVVCPSTVGFRRLTRRRSRLRHRPISVGS
jgi:hypothetical protein